jgi:hypothetical protein
MRPKSTKFGKDIFTVKRFAAAFTVLQQVFQLAGLEIILAGTLLQESNSSAFHVIRTGKPPCFMVS